MALKRVLRSGVAAACIASVAAPAGIAAPAVKAVASGVGTDVRVATTETFSRIEVGRGGALKREGQTVVLTVGRDGDADIGRLLTSPPKWIKSAVRLPVAGKTRIVITLAENADATIGQADGAVFANFFEKPAPAAAPAAAEVAVAEPEPPRPNPLPPGGVVKMASKVAAGQTQLTFDWANPAGAAVFRRGDAVWVVFDAPATLDVSSAPKNVRPLRGVRTFKAPTTRLCGSMSIPTPRSSSSRRALPGPSRWAPARSRSRTSFGWPATPAAVRRRSGLRWRARPGSSTCRTRWWATH